MSPDDEINRIKRETFDTFKDSRRVWIIEESGPNFIVHRWLGSDWITGAGVAPANGYPTLRKAAARLLQLLETGAVAPQTWSESVCIDGITGSSPCHSPMNE